jgi:hypothetical protein
MEYKKQSDQQLDQQLDKQSDQHNPIYYETNIIYKSMISNDLKDDILNYYLNLVDHNVVSDNGSAYFPKRKTIKNIPQHFAQQLEKELLITMSQYYLKFIPNIDYIRIYHSNYGIVKPHKDVPTKPTDTHTCLIYLTDDFYGGILSVKIPRSEEHIKLFHQEEKKHITVTIEPRQSYGIIFPKNMVHYNDELLGGDKIILLIDCEIDY